MTVSARTKCVQTYLKDVKRYSREGENTLAYKETMYINMPKGIKEHKP